MSDYVEYDKSETVRLEIWETSEAKRPGYCKWQVVKREPETKTWQIIERCQRYETFDIALIVGQKALARAVPQ